jgi:hypothetical protein
MQPAVDVKQGTSGVGTNVNSSNAANRLPKLEDFLSKRDFIGALTLLEVKLSKIWNQSLDSLE